MSEDIMAIVEYTSSVARQAWEPFWPVWKAIAGHPCPDGELPSQDACIPTSFTMAHILNKMVPEYRWKAVGGRPTKRTSNGGYLDRGGVPRAHIWTVGTSRGDVIVVDLTADQFGGEPVIATFGSSRHCSNATTSLVRRFAEHEAPTIEAMVVLFDKFLRLSPDMQKTERASLGV